ncbi:hypothetical protein BH09PSE4_BH09PSE4_09640 [soil metagenome]
MNAVRLSLLAAAIAALPALTAPVSAQYTQTNTIQPVSDGDRLAEQMRVLAVNPLDVNALIAAGELTLKMGDVTAARGFFMRADRISMRDGRIKAGLAKVLVQLEKPGEALRLFGEAESLGLDSYYYAAERGLAYDLVGQQGRAQRDYRSALKQGPDDETTRRYALSLGISGLSDQAFALLDPMLRKSDRGAWRARAFILAMNGDAAAANRIAVNMMPPGMAQGLAPFFQRLPSLSAVDRAFAVHFGEVRPTADRIADARLVPPLASLPPEPVQVATQSVMLAKPDKKARKPKRGHVDVALASQPSAPEPMPPAYQAPPEDRPPAVMAYAQQPAPIVSAPPERRPVQVAAVTGPLPEHHAVQIASVASPSPERAPLPRGSIPAETNVRVTEAAPPAPVIATRPGATVTAVPTVTAPPPVAEPAPLPQATVTLEQPAPSPVERAPQAPIPAAPQRVTGTEDAILAAIVANISVPASELGVEPMPGATPVRNEIAQAAPALQATAEATPSAPAIDKVALAKKAAADKKALADKKAAADKLAADKKAAAEKKALAKADPSRIWVQVAGGASEGDLAREWKRVSAKAPEAFKGRVGWTTPLRATNRVLAGPFKTDAEARAFVNSLAKQGISAFAFTSDVGQKITKLGAK